MSPPWWTTGSIIRWMPPCGSSTAFVVSRRLRWTRRGAEIGTSPVPASRRAVEPWPCRLDGKVDPDPAERTHRVCGIADAQQAVDQTTSVPRFDASAASPRPSRCRRHPRRGREGSGWHCWSASTPSARNRASAPFGMSRAICTCPSRGIATKTFAVVSEVPRIRSSASGVDPEPPTSIPECSSRTGSRASSRAFDQRPSATTEWGPELDLDVGPDRANADDTVALTDQGRHLCAHPQVESRFVLSRLGEQVEEVPLRGDGHIRVRSVQRDRSPGRNPHPSDPGADIAHSTVGDAGEAMIEPEFVEQSQGRGVDGVATEVAEEILVLLPRTTTLTPPRAKRQASHDSGRGRLR